MKKNFYVLNIDGLSVCKEEMQIVLNTGSQFEHKLGRFYVEHIDGSSKEYNVFSCKVVVLETHLSGELIKGRSFRYSGPNGTYNLYPLEGLKVANSHIRSIPFWIPEQNKKSDYER